MNNFYYGKYLKYKNKYLELKKINDDDAYNNISFVESHIQINSQIKLTTMVFFNNTKEIHNLPIQISNLIIQQSLKTTNCDFWTDYQINEKIFLEPGDNFIIIVANGKLLGYMNFAFVQNLMSNNFIYGNEHYMGIYINTMCSFSKNTENNNIFLQIKAINNKFSVGKYIWEKFIEYLLSIKDKIKYQYRTSYDWKYFIFNKSTTDAYNYHKSNHMKDITIEINDMILQTKNVSGTINLYDMYDTEIENQQCNDCGKLYFIL